MSKRIFANSRVPALLVAFGATVSSGLATAAETDEIIVTVRQRAESITDVPGSVANFSANQIEQLRIERAADFVAATPGVSIVNAAEVGDSQVNIRGINGARDAETSYALVIDGIVMTNPAALNREYTNLDSIQIFKGPQGAIYGRNAAAGAIVINTQEPGENWGGKVKGSFAEDATYFVAGNVGGAVSDTVRLGLTGSFRDSDGYYRNAYRQFQGSFLEDATVDNFESWDLAARAIFEPTDALKIDAKLRYGEVDASSISFNAAFALPGLTGFGAAFYEDVNQHPFQFDNNVPHFNDQEATEFSVKVDADLGWADLTGWGLYSDIENDFGADGTSGSSGFFFSEPGCRDSVAALQGYPVAAPTYIGAVPEFPASVLGPYTPTTCDGTQYQERNQKDYSVELRLASKSDQQLRWLAGVYYLNIDRQVGVNTGVDLGQGIVQSLIVRDPDVNPTEALVYDDFDTDVYAVFGQLAYDLTDAVELSLALRYDREERDVTSLVPTDVVTSYIDTCGTLDGGDGTDVGDPINPGLCFGPLSPQSETFDAFQPKLAVTWDITDDLTAYASAGVGFKSGGFNNGGSSATIDVFSNQRLIYGTGDPDDPDSWDSIFNGDNPATTEYDGFLPVIVNDSFREEESWSYEAGVKASSLDGRLRTEVGVYYTDVDDMQFFEFFVGSFGLLRIVTNIDEVEIYGAEGSINFAATDWLDLSAGLNITESEIKEHAIRPDSVGNKSPYTPDWTANLGAQVTFPASADLDFVAGVDASLVGDTWFHVIQTEERPTGFGNAKYDRAQRDAYQIVNLRAGFQTESWSLVGFIDNAFDENYLEEVIPAPEFGGSFIHPGAERRAGIEGTFRF